MAIKGITDRSDHNLTIIGHLRKGAEADGGMGKDLGRYMRFQSPTPGVEDAFAVAFGGLQVAEIPCRLVGRTPDQVLEAWNEGYGKGGIMRRCDGQTCTLARRDDGSLDKTPTPCHAPQCFKDQRGRWQRCDATGRLSVLIPELLRAGYMGRVIAHTTSVNDLRRLTERLNDAAVVASAVGQDLGGVPVLLFRVEREISTPTGDGGAAVKRKKWLLDLEIDPDLVRRAAMGRRALPPMADEDEDPHPLALPSPAGAVAPFERARSLREMAEHADRLADFPALYRQACDAADEDAARACIGAWMEMITAYIPKVTAASEPRMRQAIAAMPRCDGRTRLQGSLDAHMASLVSELSSETATLGATTPAPVAAPPATGVPTPAGEAPGGDLWGDTEETPALATAPATETSEAAWLGEPMMLGG